MNVKAAPDLFTIEDHTRAISDVLARRPTDPAQIAIDAAQLDELYEARARRWDELGDGSFEKGVNGHLVQAAWRCGAEDRLAAARQRDRATKYSRVAAKGRK